MSDEKRVREDWQRRFGLLPEEQVRQWRGPLLSLTEMTVNAEVEAILWSRRTQALHQGALVDHADYNALGRLFANGVRVAREIGGLIGGGYPDGASARWRTLHETTVVAQFIRTNPPAIGERYRDHAGVRAYRALRRVKALAERHGEPVAPALLQAYQRAREEYGALIDKHGREFGTDYGWAAPALEGAGRPSMTGLEQAVQMDHMRHAYAAASRHVHAGPDSVPWQLDPLDGDDMRRVFGPDAGGSSIPGILVAHTFSNLRIVWRAANDSKNPFLAADLLEKDVAKIHGAGNDLMREFVDCEKGVEHLVLATQLLRTLRAAP